METVYYHLNARLAEVDGLASGGDCGAERCWVVESAPTERPLSPKEDNVLDFEHYRRAHAPEEPAQELPLPTVQPRVRRSHSRRRSACTVELPAAVVGRVFDVLSVCAVAAVLVGIFTGFLVG